jgi:hypothetical protein
MNGSASIMLRLLLLNKHKNIPIYWSGSINNNCKDEDITYIYLFIYLCSQTTLVGLDILKPKCPLSYSARFTTVSRIPLDEESANLRDLYLTFLCKCPVTLIQYLD